MPKLIQNFNNQKHKLITFILLFIALILFIIGMTYKLFQNNEVINLNSDITLNNNNKENKEYSNDINDALNKDKKEMKTDFYNISFEFPKNNQTIKVDIENTYKNWLKENEEYCKEMKKDTGDIRCEFVSNYKKYESEDSVSFVNEVYTYSGGAHGGIGYIAKTFNKNGREISIEEILPEKDLSKISDLAFNEIQKIRRQRIQISEMSAADKKEVLDNFSKDVSWIKEGTSPKRENYNVVWIDGKDIAIYFSQYQVAAYAEGDFIVKIPASMLK